MTSACLAPRANSRAASKRRASNPATSRRPCRVVAMPQHGIGADENHQSISRESLVGKCLEQLKQAVPGVSRVAVLWQPGAFGERTEKDMLKAAEVAARALGVQLYFVEARGPESFDRAFSEMTRARAGALTVLSSNMFVSERRRLVDLAAKNRLPAMYNVREYVDAGGLMAYGPSLANLYRRAATYVA